MLYCTLFLIVLVIVIGLVRMKNVYDLVLHVN